MHEKIWTKNFVALLFSRAGSSAAFSLLTTAMVLYVVERYGETTAMAGFATGLFVVSSVLGRIWAGARSEGFGEDAIIRNAAVVFLICCILYLPVDNMFLLLIVRFVHGVSFGALTNCLSTAVAKSLPLSRMGEGMGYFSLGSTIAYAVGPAVGISLSQNGLFAPMFGVCAVFALVVVVCGFCLGSALKKDCPRSVWHQGRETADIDLSALPISGIAAVVNVCYASLTAFLPAFSACAGLSANAPYFFVVYSAALISARPIMGKLLDRSGAKAAILPLFLAGGAGFLLLAFVRNVVGFYAAAVLVSFGYGSLFTNLQTQLIVDQPPEKYGASTAVFFSLADIGLGIGPMIWGVLLGFMGYEQIYAVAGALEVLLFAMFPLSCRNFMQSSKTMR